MTLVKLFALRLVRLVSDGGWDRFYADTYFRSNFARYTRTPSTWFIVFHILCSSIDLTCVERREQNIIYIEFILYHLLINSIVVSFVCYVCSAYMQTFCVCHFPHLFYSTNKDPNQIKTFVMPYCDNKTLVCHFLWMSIRATCFLSLG